MKRNSMNKTQAKQSYDHCTFSNWHYDHKRQQWSVDIHDPKNRDRTSYVDPIVVELYKYEEHE